MRKDKKLPMMLAMILSLTMSSAACSQKPTPTPESNTAVDEEKTSTDNDNDGEEERKDVDESFGAADPDYGKEDEKNNDAEFSEEDEGDGELVRPGHDHQGEITPPKHSTSKTPPENPTEEDIGVEGDDTWYIDVGGSIIPNFEKHIGEDINVKVDSIDAKLGDTLGTFLKKIKKKGYSVVGNYERMEDCKFEPGDELTLGITDGEKIVMTIKAFNPYKKDYVQPEYMQLYYFSVNVAWLDDFDFLFIDKFEGIYNYQFIKKSEQFPVAIDEATIFCLVETGLGYAGFYDTGGHALEGFIYYLSDEEKEKRMKEEFDEEVR